MALSTQAGSLGGKWWDCLRMGNKGQMGTKEQQQRNSVDICFTLGKAPITYTPFISERSNEVDWFEVGIPKIFRPTRRLKS